MADHPFPVMYADDDILVINKPAGWVVQPGAGKSQDTVIQAIHEAGMQLPEIDGPLRGGIVHRLDRDTDGLMVIAKTGEAYDGLSSQFANRAIRKRYYAVVTGNLRHGIVIDQPIARNQRHRHRMAVHPEGKPSITIVEIIASYNTKTWVDIVLVTGRTHQIRVHLAHIGHPLLGDCVYGKSKRGTGQLLQAYFLAFTHPVSGQALEFQIPPSDRLGVKFNSKLDQ